MRLGDVSTKRPSAVTAQRRVANRSLGSRHRKDQSGLDVAVEVQGTGGFTSAATLRHVRSERCPGRDSNPHTPRGAGGFKQHTERPSRASASVRCALIRSFARGPSTTTARILLVALSPLGKR